MSKALRSKTVHGVTWSAIERLSVQGVQFVVQIIMARLLLPADYGVIGMLLFFTSISQSIIDSGFSNALIRKQNRTETDYSTVFYFNIVVGIIMYILLFVASPWISSFYDTPILEPVTKVVALTLFINSLSVVPRAYLTIQINFKTQAKASLIAVAISAIVGIVMAYHGYGVWALAVQSVCSSGFTTLFLWAFIQWRPRKSFSWNSFHEMFAFGGKILLSGLIDTIYRNVYMLVIGKKFSAAELGNFTRANHFAQFPSSNLTGILQRVTYPILSSINDDEYLQYAYRKYLRMSVFIVFPLMLGLAVVSRPLIQVVLTEKWDGVVLLLQLLCLSAMWIPIHAINLNLLQVKGRMDLFLRLEVLKKIIGVIVLVVTIPYGVVTMCIGMVFTSILCLVINTHYTGKLIHVDFFMQMKDLLPSLLYALSMSGAVLLVIGCIDGYFFQLISGVLVGGGYYIVIAYATRSKELRELLSLIKSF